MGYRLESVSPKVFGIGDMELKGVTRNNILPEKEKFAWRVGEKGIAGQSIWNIWINFSRACLIYGANNIRQQNNLPRLMPNEVKP